MNLYDVLRQQGHEVFIDQIELKAGDPLLDRIGEALAASQSGVLIWSKATADSKWVAREYATLENQVDAKPGFCFVPIVLDGSGLPPMIATRIYLDFSGAATLDYGIAGWGGPPFI